MTLVKVDSGPPIDIPDGWPGDWRAHVREVLDGGPLPDPILTRLGRRLGACATGSGDGARSVDLPPPPDRTAHDSFAVINAAYERGRYVSPLDHQVHVALDDDPSEDLREFGDISEPAIVPEIDPEFIPNFIHANVTPPEPAMPKPAAPVTPIRPQAAVRVTLPVQLAEAALSCCSGPPCGEPLTGGGAPRGWVLARTIGGGAPRRYCGPFCAAAAITGPARLASMPDPQPEKRDANRVTGKRTRRAYSADEKRQWVEWYVRDQMTSEQIAERAGVGKAAVQSAIRDAGIARPRGGARVSPLAEHGLAAAQVRQWALEHAVPVSAHGAIARATVDAYLAAHPPVAPATDRETA